MNYYKMMIINVLLGMVVIAMTSLNQNWLLTIIGILWIITPYIMYKISVIPEKSKIQLEDTNREYLKGIAQKTWQFFKKHCSNQFLFRVHGWE